MLFLIRSRDFCLCLHGLKSDVSALVENKEVAVGLVFKLSSYFFDKRRKGNIV